MKYLTRRKGTLWFQLRVPQVLVPHYGTIIRQCLQTAELSVAQPIALQLAGQWLSRFSAEKLDAETYSAVAVLPPPSASPPDPYTQQAIANPAMAGQQVPWPGYGASSQPTLHQVPPGYGYPPQGLPSQPQFQPPQFQQLSHHAQQQPVQQPMRPARLKVASKTTPDGIESMDDVLNYWRRMRPDLSKSTLREFEAAAKEFKKIVRKRPADLERLDIAAYRDKLISNKLARSTVSKKVGFISTMLQAAYDGGHLSQNVARGLRIPKAKVPDITRRAFTTQELKRIFTSPVYTQKKRTRACGGEAMAWIPLIALATGARLEEICQLRVDDIIFDSEHGPLLRITDEGEGQSLKTASSRRIIPIHTNLIGAGLLEYHEAIREKEYVWLFPHLEPDHDGRRGGTFGQGFSRWLRSSQGCCILDRRVVFHSFRHTFKTLCRESGLSEELHDALTGHAGQTVGRTYGHMPISALVEAVSRIRFPIEFPRIDA